MRVERYGSHRPAKTAVPARGRPLFRVPFVPSVVDPLHTINSTRAGWHLSASATKTGKAKPIELIFSMGNAGP